MTNVLIGIIGVILFIGLAVAAAWYLGPKFQQAASNSKAMSITHMESQITAAISMKRTDDGTFVVARSPVRDLQVGGYLKTVPLNPYAGDGGLPFRILYSGDLESAYYYADVVFMTLGQSEGAEQVCRAINRQGGSETVPRMPAEDGQDIQAMVQKPSGCFRVHANGIYGEAAGNDYVAYARI